MSDLIQCLFIDLHAHHAIIMAGLFCLVSSVVIVLSYGVFHLRNVIKRAACCLYWFVKDNGYQSRVHHEITIRQNYPIVGNSDRHNWVFVFR